MMKTTSIRSAKWMLALSLACPAISFADGPTSRPTGGPPGAGMGGRLLERRNGGPRPNPNRAAISAEQWDTILAFMHDHSPHRIEELQNVIAAADEKKANYLKQLVAAQYDYVMSLKNEDSELYDLQLQKIEAQDAIYNILRDAGKRPLPDERKEAFREEVSKLVDVNLSERSRRIEKARDSLAKADKALEYDRTHRDAMVDDRMDQFLKEGARPLRMDPPPDKSTQRGPDDPGARAPVSPVSPASQDAYARADQALNAVLLPSITR